MKQITIALLFLTAILIAGTLPSANAAPSASPAMIENYWAANHTIQYADGTSTVLLSPNKQKTNNKATVKPTYDLPTWMPKPFDGTAETCKQGIIGKNSMGKKICFKPRRGRN